MSVSLKLKVGWDLEILKVGIRHYISKTYGIFILKKTHIGFVGSMMCFQKKNLFGIGMQPKKWDSPMLKNLAIIRACLVSLTCSKESAILQLSKWGRGQKFNTSSAYEFLRHKGTIKPWANIVWRLFITPKHYFIL